MLTERGLAAALQAIAARFPFKVSLDVTDERLPETVEVAAYYVVAESLTNVAKHADASNATVAVRGGDGSVLVEVADDGRGASELTGGSGLAGLRDRVEALRGRLSVTSRPEAGTTVRAELPLT
jgi:signal transduction histidine kinase